MKTLRISRVALLGALLALAACSTDGPLDPSVRPDLPPVDAVNADFSFFVGREPAAGGETDNWELSLSRINAARTEMEGPLEVPFAVLDAVSGVMGTRDGSNWRWPFSFAIDDIIYDGELRSGISAGQYTWDLYINAPDHEPPLTNYLWATALVGAQSGEGRWWLADHAAGTSEVEAVVTWIVNDEDDVEFAFSNDENTAWVYQRSNNLNVLSRIFAGATEYRVTWHSDTGIGSTWTADTNVTQCWNADLHDVVCP